MGVAIAIAVSVGATITFAINHGYDWTTGDTIELGVVEHVQQRSSTYVDTAAGSEAEQAPQAVSDTNVVTTTVATTDSHTVAFYGHHENVVGATLSIVKNPAAKTDRWLVCAQRPIQTCGSLVKMTIATDNND